MDIITAIKSGKPYKRMTWESKHFYMLPGQAYSLTNADILADDWITKETKVEITESEFWDAARKQLELLMKEMHLEYAPRVCQEDMIRGKLLGAVAKELFGKKEK